MFETCLCKQDNLPAVLSKYICQTSGAHLVPSIDTFQISISCSHFCPYKEGVVVIVLIPQKNYYHANKPCSSFKGYDSGWMMLASVLLRRPSLVRLRLHALPAVNVGIFTSNSAPLLTTMAGARPSYLQQDLDVCSTTLQLCDDCGTAKSIQKPQAELLA